MITAPCLVIGTPRSRTAWLSAMLSSPGRVFLHEPAAAWAGLADMCAFLDRHGAACDSGLSLFWQDVVAHRPDCRIAVILRPVEEVISSLIHLGVPVSVATWDVVRKIYAAASEAAMHKGTFLASYADLQSNLVCANLYRFMHGYEPPVGWIRHWQKLHVQRDWREQATVVEQNRDGMPRLLAERAQRREEARCRGQH